MSRWSAGGGEMAARIASHDWVATPLGPAAGWPPALRAAVEMMLASPSIATVVIGEDRLFLYNDAAAALYGDRHPDALGRPLAAVFAHEAERVAPFYDRAFGGEGVHVPAQPLDPAQTGDEQLFTAFLTPIRDAAGTVIAVHMTGFAVAGPLRAAAALRESEERFRAFVTASSDVVYRMSADWTEMRALDGRGVLADTVTPNTRWNEAYILPRDWPMVKRAIGRAIAGRSLFELEHRVRLADGTVGWTLSRAAPILDGDGRIVEWLGAASDITPRKRAEQLLRDSEDRLSFLLELNDAVRPLASPDDIAVTSCRLLAEHVDASRVQYSVVEGGPGEEMGEVRGECVRSGPPMRHHHAFAPFGEAVLEVLRGGRTLVLRDTEVDPRLGEPQREAFRAAASPAVISVPLVKEGRIVAVLTAHCRHARDWSPREIGMVEDVADRTWAAIERARLDEALRHSEERFRTLFEAMGQGYILLELIRDRRGRAVDHRLLQVNPAFERLTGLSAAGAVGRTSRELVPELEVELTDTYDRVVCTGRPAHVEQYVAGLRRWYDIWAYPAGGDRLVILYEDVSARKEAELRLRAREERQAFLLRLSDTLRAQRTEDAVTAVATRMLAEELGLDLCYAASVRWPEDRAVVTHQFRRGDMPEMPATLRLSSLPRAFRRSLDGTLVFEDMIHDPELADARWRNAAAMHLGALVAAPVRRGRGNPIWSIVAAMRRPRRWTSGEVALVEEMAERTWVAVERARAEAALRESERRLQTLVEGVPQLVWRAEEGGDWTWASPQWSAFTGQSDRDSHGRGWLDPVHPDDRPRVEAIWRDAIGRGEFRADYRIHNRQEDRYRWFQTRATPVRNDDGRIVEWLGTSTDIDDLRRLQDRQQVLVAELQHRTRNLMGVVRSITEKTARASADLPDFMARFATRLDALARIQGLLSRLGEDDRVTIGDLIRTELAAMDGGEDERVTLHGPADVRLRSSTVQTLAMALHELATNAVKYGALGRQAGRLAITWSLEAAAGSRPWLHIDWRESGVTMPPERIMPPGTGQGRELIEQALPYQLGARTAYRFTPDGVHCTIAMPVSASTMDRDRHA